MGTRASIKVKDGDDIFFLYQGHDGYESNVMPFLNKSIAKYHENRYSGDIDWFTTNLLMDLNSESICTMITSSVHGDEECFYEINYNNKTKEWEAFYV